MQDMHRLANQTSHQQGTANRRADSEVAFTSNIFDVIRDSNLPAPEKTPARMASEAFEILGAGSLTTAKVASNTSFYILADPNVRMRLQDELQEAFPDAQKHLPLKTLEELPYLVSLLHQLPTT